MGLLSTTECTYLPTYLEDIASLSFRENGMRVKKFNFLMLF